MVPGADGGWIVKKGGAVRASRHFQKKSEAESWGRQVSIHQGSELFIHRRDGTVERKDSHGADPMPSNGRG